MSSAWSLELNENAQKQLRKLDKAVAARIVSTILRDLDRLGDPRLFGEAMVGNYTGYWRYRAGDYRAICSIRDEIVTVVVIEVAHRREIYR